MHSHTFSWKRQRKLSSTVRVRSSYPPRIRTFCATGQRRTFSTATLIKVCAWTSPLPCPHILNSVLRHITLLSASALFSFSVHCGSEFESCFCCRGTNRHSCHFFSACHVLIPFISPTHTCTATHDYQEVLNADQESRRVCRDLRRPTYITAICMGIIYFGQSIIIILTSVWHVGLQCMLQNVTICKFGVDNSFLRGY